jgi:anti-anti-sigma factor
MPFAALEQSHSQIVEAVAPRLSKRTASTFQQAGEEACREYVEAALRALVQDLETGKSDAVRTHVYSLMDDLGDKGLSFSDLRFYIRVLREQIQHALANETEGPRLKVERWFFEMLLVGTMRFMAWRDEMKIRESAKRGVERLESQLAELEVALAEKTELLDVIRQASTPIAPVVRGILVVPMVGTFDTFRAEVLTEKLLQEISRVHARAAILDISGVPMFDTEAAQLLIRLARSVRLLGTELILVGMSPANARTIVALGVDLGNIETFGTLQAGLARALKLRRLKVVPI